MRNLINLELMHKLTADLEQIELLKKCRKLKIKNSSQAHKQALIIAGLMIIAFCGFSAPESPANSHRIEIEEEEEPQVFKTHQIIFQSPYKKNEGKEPTPQPEPPITAAKPDFDKAIPLILQIEGGFSDDKDDEGGVTNFGIAQASHPHVNVRKLTKRGAIAIYKRNYWQASHAYKQPSSELALMHFDASVNHGIGTASWMLRRSKGSYARYKQIRLDYYDRLVAVKPVRRKYLQGWRNRIRKLDRYIASTSNTKGV